MKELEKYVLSIYLFFDTFFIPMHVKSNKMASATVRDKDQPGHRPSLIRVISVHMNELKVLINILSAQRRLWIDRVDAQDDPSRR